MRQPKTEPDPPAGHPSPHESAQERVLALEARVAALERLAEERAEALARLTEEAEAERVEHARAMSELERAQDDLEQVQRVAGLGSWVSDPDTRGRLTWSKETHRIFGLSAGDFDGRVETFFAMVHPDDRAAVAAASQAALSGGASYSIDHRIVRPDGAVRWVHEEAAVERDPGGAPRRMLGTVLDITAQREAEEALAQGRERYRALLEGVPDYIYRLDRAGLILDFHAPPGAPLPMPLPEIAGRDFGDFFSPEEAELGRAAITRALATGEVQILESRGGHQPGRLYESRVMRSGEGEVTVISRDVTELRAMQERLRASERLASVGTLAAGVAHEINNPLAYVIANLGFIEQQLRHLESPVFAEVGQALAEAIEGSDRVKQIVRDLKTFSRVDDERRAPLDVHKTLETAVSLAHNELRHRARLVREYAAVPRVLANEGRLGQVFVNLLVNAAQALPEGAAQEHAITLRTRTDPLGRAVVAITDDGHGIAPEILPRIFEPFFTTKPVGEGTGLGLAICHGIVAGLGGEIAVESAPGRGSTFRVILPPAPQVPSRPASAEVPALTLESGPRARVLVVDDETLIGTAAERMLRSYHDVVSLTSAREELARLAAGERYDVILCDVMMPETSGMDFYDALPDHLRPRTAFITGGAFTPAARSFLERVRQPRIEKPFEVGDLLALIARILRGPS